MVCFVSSHQTKEYCTTCRCTGCTLVRFGSHGVGQSSVVHIKEQANLKSLLLILSISVNYQTIQDCALHIISTFWQRKKAFCSHRFTNSTRERVLALSVLMKRHCRGRRAISLSAAPGRIPTNTVEDKVSSALDN